MTAAAAAAGVALLPYAPQLRSGAQLSPNTSCPDSKTRPGQPARQIKGVQECLALAIQRVQACLAPRCRTSSPKLSTYFLSTLPQASPNWSACGCTSLQAGATAGRQGDGACGRAVGRVGGWVGISFAAGAQEQPEALGGRGGMGAERRLGALHPDSSPPRAATQCVHHSSMFWAPNPTQHLQTAVQSFMGQRPNRFSGRPPPPARRYRASPGRAVHRRYRPGRAVQSFMGPTHPARVSQWCYLGQPQVLGTEGRGGKQGNFIPFTGQARS